MFNEKCEVTIANIYWALITPTTLFQALRMFYPSLQIKDTEALSWKLPQSVSAYDGVRIRIQGPDSRFHAIIYLKTGRP